jgi:hypothetical protein
VRRQRYVVLKLSSDRAQVAESDLSFYNAIGTQKTVYP